MSRWKLGSMVRINGLFHLLINGVYWGYNPLILIIDPNFQRDIQASLAILVFLAKKGLLIPKFFLPLVGWPLSQMSAIFKNPWDFLLKKSPLFLLGGRLKVTNILVKQTGKTPKTNGWRAPQWWALQKVRGPLNMAIFGIHVRFLGCIFQNHFFFEANTNLKFSTSNTPPPSFQIPVPCGLTGFHPAAMILEYMVQQKSSSWKFHFPKK